MGEGYAKINKAKEDVAKEILDEIYQLHSTFETNLGDYKCGGVDDFVNKITDYIEKKHLFKSDYTK